MFFPPHFNIDCCSAALQHLLDTKQEPVYQNTLNSDIILTKVFKLS